MRLKYKNEAEDGGCAGEEHIQHEMTEREGRAKVRWEGCETSVRFRGWMSGVGCLSQLQKARVYRVS